MRRNKRRHNVVVCVFNFPSSGVLKGGDGLFSSSNGLFSTTLGRILSAMMSHPICFFFSPHTAQPVYQASLKPMFFNCPNPKYEGVDPLPPKEIAPSITGRGGSWGEVWTKHRTIPPPSHGCAFLAQHAILKLRKQMQFCQGGGAVTATATVTVSVTLAPPPPHNPVACQVDVLVSIMLTTARTTLRRSRRGPPMAQSWVTTPHAKISVDCLLDWLLVVTLGRS